MYWKYVCSDFQCPVYVFGTSTNGVCPGCEAPGDRTTEAEGEAFVDWYHGVPLAT